MAPIRTLLALPPEPLAIGGWLRDADQPTPVCYWSKTGMFHALWNGFHGHAYKENIDKCDTYSVMGQMMNIYLQR